MAKKATQKTDRSVLYVRCRRQGGFPPDLLGRVNAAAELIGMDRDEFVVELLTQEMERLEATQKDTRKWWESRTARKNP